MTERVADGPYFEDLHRGQVFDTAPGLSLSSGRAAAHQAIVGDRLRLALDDDLAMAVAGRSPLVHPALVWDAAIGQSTVATHHVKANLFYRGLALHRLPAVGDTLYTSTEVIGLRQNAARDGRPATGLAALRIRTADQRGNSVLDFMRCAMIALRDPSGQTEHADDLARLVPAVTVSSNAVFEEWDLAALSRRSRATSLDRLAMGDIVTVSGGDVVSSAPELARLTLNIAAVHHDEVAAGGRRLVYGGHVIGVALAQAARALPGLAIVTAWDSCDHLAPVHEGDTLRSAVEIEAIAPLADGPGALLQLCSRVWADTVHSGSGAVDRTQVLDWRFTTLVV